MSELRDQLLTLARKTDHGALEAKFDEAVGSCPEDLELFLTVGDTLRTHHRDREAHKLLIRLSDRYKAEGSPEERVKLFQFLSECDHEDTETRKAFAQALRDHHEDRPAFDLFVEAADLVEGNLKAGLKKLDEMRRYDVGAYVLHAASWGIGKVVDADLSGRELMLEFESGMKHSLPVLSALDILNPLPSDDWRVLRAFNPDEMKRICEEDPGLLVARILNQFGRSLDSTGFKALLLDKVIPKAQWTKWWAAARRAALKRPDVVQEGRGNKLVFQDPEASDILADLEGSKTVRQALDLAENHLRNLSSDQSADQEHHEQLVTALLQNSGKHATPRDHAPLEILLLAGDVAEEKGVDATPVSQALQMQSFKLEEMLGRLASIKNPRLFKRGIAFLSVHCANQYEEILLGLVPATASLMLEHVVSEAIGRGLQKDVRDLINEAIKRPESLPELLVWSFRRRDTPAFESVLHGLDSKILLSKSISLGEAKGKSVDPNRRRLSRAVATDLLADDAKRFRAFLNEINGNEAELLRRKFERLRGLSEAAHSSLLDVFNEVHRRESDEPEVDNVELDDSIIFTTEEGLTKRQEEYDHIVNIRLPAIFDAIGKAASFGDLSENAEYTAALEERTAMTRKAEEMQDELSKARRLDSSVLEEGKVTVGTRVRVFDEEQDKEETFTLLGPWDANIDAGILDYRAPLARALLGQKVGGKVQTEIGGKTRRYEVRAVETAI